MAVLILDPAGIEVRLRRMAYELAERNADVEQLHLLGLGENGLLMAENLAQRLQTLGLLSAQVWALPKRTSTFELQPAWKQAALVLVDDVLYTGQTLLQALIGLEPVGATSIQSLVLVDRGHHSLPVAADVLGLNLATTLQQYVKVEGDSLETWRVYLT